MVGLAYRVAEGEERIRYRTMHQQKCTSCRDRDRMSSRDVAQCTVRHVTSRHNINDTDVSSLTFLSSATCSSIIVTLFFPP